VARFWGQAEDTSGLTTIADLVARRAAWHADSIRPAVAADGEAHGPADAHFVTLSAPDEQDVAEFISAEAIKSRHGDAFALRVDGDSMAPDILPGDVVVLSPSVPAVQGRPAVVQLAGQIGVTCKLYRSEGGQVHLVPANGTYEIATFPAEQIEWALRVLARVRG
jgi:phage repressor protein C with HTH and peptisase S24 domain